MIKAPIQPAIITQVSTSRKRLLIFLLVAAVHIPLFFLMKQYRVVATGHAVATLLFGLYVLLHDATPTRMVYVAGYISTAELLWRMTKAGVFWEYGKYALVALFFFGLLKYRVKVTFLPILYIAVLLPSVLMLFGMGFNLDSIIDKISFNLSGPVSLAFSVMFLRSFKFDRQKLLNFLLTMLVPIGALSAWVLISTLRSEAIVFTDASNFATSGGFGPNQVSVILGLGVLVAYVYFLFEDRLPGVSRLLVLGTATLLLIQSILTYSRGGVFNLLIPLPLATLAGNDLTTRNKRAFLLGIAAVALLGYFLFPSLETWTGGTLTQRYTMLDTTGREQLVDDQLKTFLENPIFGVGPGLSGFYALTQEGIVIAAHTEYSRLLAEHGIFGAAALFFLALMTLGILRRSKTPAERWLTLAFVSWALLDMSHAAMRLSAISLLFGLSQAQFSESDS